MGAFWAVNSYGYQRGLTALHPVAYTALGLLLVFAMRPALVEKLEHHSTRCRGPASCPGAYVAASSYRGQPLRDS